MNGLDDMPPKCHDCPYWELSEEPYSCDGCETLMYYMAEDERDYDK